MSSVSCAGPKPSAAMEILCFMGMPSVFWLIPTTLETHNFMAAYLLVNAEILTYTVKISVKSPGMR